MPCHAKHHLVPRLPREPKTDVRLRHACHVKCHSCATPATQSAAASRASGPTKSGPSATECHECHPATRNEGGCEIVPRLPRKTKVDVKLCHACHASLSSCLLFPFLPSEVVLVHLRRCCDPPEVYIEFGLPKTVVLCMSSRHLHLQCS